MIGCECGSCGWANCFRKDRRDSELATELESHLEMPVEDKCAPGWVATKRAARRRRSSAVWIAEENYRARRASCY